jgi:hypothetical protein
MAGAVRRLLLALAFVALAAPCYAGFSSRVQGCHSSVSGAVTTANCTLGASQTAANVSAIAFLYSDTTGGNAGTVTAADNNGKTYALTPNSPSNARPATAGLAYLLYMIVPSGAGTVITVNWTTSSAFLFAADMWVMEFAVTSGTAAFDADVAGTGASGTAVNTPTVTVAGSSELLVSCAIADHQVTSVNGVWTQEAAGSGNPLSEGVGYDLSASSNTAVDMTMNTSSGWDSIGMSFTFTPSGGTCTPTLALMGVGRCGH